MKSKRERDHYRSSDRAGSGAAAADSSVRLSPSHLAALWPLFGAGLAVACAAAAVERATAGRGGVTKGHSPIEVQSFVLRVR